MNSICPFCGTSPNDEHDFLCGLKNIAPMNKVTIPHTELVKMQEKLEILRALVYDAQQNDSFKHINGIMWHDRATKTLKK